MLPRGTLPVIVLTFALVAVPIASAQVGGFGYHVTTDDGTARFDLRTGGPTAFTFQDDNGDDAPSPGEPVWASVSTSTIRANDIRLTDGIGAAGSQVKASDADAGRSVGVIEGDLKYFDENGNDRFERNDTLYWDRDDNNRDRVSTQDLVLSGDRAGEPVGSSGPFLGLSLTSVNGELRYHDTDGNGAFSQGDRVYMDVRQDGTVGAPDVRIGNPGGYPVGSYVTPGDTDASLRLRTGSHPSNIVFIDDTGTGFFSANDPALLSSGTGTVSAGSIRIANPQHREVGSVVKGSDSDGGRTSQILSGTLSYANLAGGSAFGPGDVLYVDRSNGDQNSADTNDIILSGPDAGYLVRDRTGHQGAGLEDAPGSIKYVDTDGDDRYSPGDMVYLDADSDGFVSPGDVQLTNHQSSDPPAPSDTDGDGVPDDEDGCPDQAADTSDGCPADTTDGGDGSDGSDGGTGDDGGSDSALQEAEEAQREAQQAQQSAQEALDAANDAKRIAEENSELIAQVRDKLNETGQNGSPGPAMVLALLGLAGAALALRRRS